MESIGARDGNKLFNRFVMQIRHIMHRGPQHVHIEGQQQPLWLHDDCKKLCPEECTGLVVVGLAWHWCPVVGVQTANAMEAASKKCDVTV